MMTKFHRSLINRCFSAFLGITIFTATILAALPQMTTAVYAGSGKNASNTMFGTSGMADPTPGTTGPSQGASWEGSYVYYGKYNDAMKYRVLDTVATEFGGKTMLLDCDNTIGNMRFDDNSNLWADSEIRAWLNGDEFYNKRGVFTLQEKAAITISTKAAKATRDGDGRQDFGYAPLSPDANHIDHIFLLDAVEATRASYGYANTADDHTTRRKYGTSDWWWLRSPIPDPTISDHASDVVYDGKITRHFLNIDDIGVSPAFNLNLESVIFSSAISGTMGATNTVYTLTLKDSTISATIDTDSITRSVDGVISVSYSGLANCSRLAVLMTDKEYADGNTNGAAIKYYTGLTPPSGDLSTTGTATFSLPENYDSSWSTYIIPERCIEGNFTDYAGDFIPIELPNRVEVTASPEEGGNPTVSIQGGEPAKSVITMSEMEVSLKANPGENYHFVKWEVISPEGRSVDVPTSEDTKYLTNSNDAVIQAVYEQDEPEPGKHKVTVKANPKESGEAKVRIPGGEYRTEVQDVKDTKVQLKAEEKDNYHFKEWKKISGNGELKNKDSKDNATYIIGTDDAEIEAIFEGDEPVPPKPEQHTITFIVDGKEIKAETDENGKLKEFPPDPKKEGYVFAGWYDAEEGGARIREDTVFTEDTKVYAHWNKEKPKPKPHKHDDDDDGSSEEPVKAAVVNPDALLAQFLVNGVKLDTAKFGKQVQGPMGQAAFNAGRPLGWQQAFTFNMTVADKADYSIKNGYLILTIPQEYQKEGRTFAIMGLDQNGASHIFNDTDTIPSTVTAKVNLGGYAFALIYKD